MGKYVDEDAYITKLETTFLVLARENAEKKEYLAQLSEDNQALREEIFALRTLLENAGVTLDDNPIDEADSTLDIFDFSEISSTEGCGSESENQCCGSNYTVQDNSVDSSLSGQSKKTVKRKCEDEDGQTRKRLQQDS